MLLIVIISMCALLLGYLWGKHNGRVEGYKHGIVDLPLLLREQSLQQGYCVLCQEQKQGQVVSATMLTPLFDGLTVEHHSELDT